MLELVGEERGGTSPFNISKLMNYKNKKADILLAYNDQNEKLNTLQQQQKVLFAITGLLLILFII